MPREKSSSGREEAVRVCEERAFVGKPEARSLSDGLFVVRWWLHGRRVGASIVVEWSPVRSSSSERWRGSRHFRRRVRVREEARADGRKASQRTKGKSPLFSFLVYLGCVCMCVRPRLLK